MSECKACDIAENEAIADENERAHLVGELELALVHTATLRRAIHRALDELDSARSALKRDKLILTDDLVEQAAWRIRRAYNSVMRDQLSHMKVKV